MKRHYLIVLNPKPNRSKKKWLTWLIGELKQKEFNYSIYTTAQNLSDNQLFFSNNLTRYSDVVVLGGDGTLHMLANCLAFSNKPIAILPCGTGNDFMRNFNYSTAKLKELVFSNNSRQICLGKVNDRYFINIAGIGFDTEVVKRTMNDKGPLAKASYLLKAAKVLLSYRSQKLKISNRKDTFEYNNFLTVFANGRYFGGGMKIAPDADISLPNLDCYHISNAPLYKKLWAFLNIYGGRHTRLSEVKASRDSLYCIEQPNLLIEADGELIGETPAQITLVRGALTLKTI